MAQIGWIDPIRICRRHWRRKVAKQLRSHAMELNMSMDLCGSLGSCLFEVASRNPGCTHVKTPRVPVRYVVIRCDPEKVFTCRPKPANNKEYHNKSRIIGEGRQSKLALFNITRPVCIK